MRPARWGTAARPETAETRPTRPEPDEVALDDAPQPQPERGEGVLADPAPSDLSLRDWLAVLRRGAKRMLHDNMTMIAQALAYSSFLAIPSVLLVVIGLFTLFASPATVTHVIDHLNGVIPSQAKSLLAGSLQRLDHQHRATVVMAAVGFVLALWSTTGAMTSYMTALNLAYERRDRRSFFKKRLTALLMVACIGVAFLLVAVFLLLGPVIEKHLSHAVGNPTVVGYVWWIAQWPILVVGLLAAFAALLYLGPDVDHPRWRFLTVGSAIAVVIWLGASGAFAYYTAHFASYNKTWGSISAVIVMLTWLWLTALALLFGAEVNAEAERSRELRSGEPAERSLQVPSRA
ncbi:MAG TPA: YihY/virulence factor BrkB family protein [Gaiellaceae bacterium]|nr:YihY/virulence factor BrkB family protein [Gaiellaceae bacterium]